MTNVCPKCGLWRPDKAVDIEESSVVCPECEYRHPFRFLPLLIVGGPAGWSDTLPHARGAEAR